MAKYPTLRRGGLVLESDTPNQFDFSINIIDQNKLVMKAGAEATQDSSKLETWLQTIDNLDDLMAGWWDGVDTEPAQVYTNKVKALRDLPCQTDSDRRTLGHLKLRALMVLERMVGFQGDKTGKGYFSKSAQGKNLEVDDESSQPV